MLRRVLDWIQVAKCSPVFFFLIVAHSILGDPEDVSRVGRKGATMVFSKGWTVQKIVWISYVLYPQIDEQHLLILLVCSYTTGIASLHFSGCSPKSEMHAVPKLSVWYEPRPFQNTVYPETETWIRVYGWFKDAQFPKLQAWAYNTYSNSHRTRLFFLNCY